MQALIDLLPGVSSKWLAYALLLIGMLLVWSGGRMGRQLVRPWTGPPHEWLPKNRRVLIRAILILCLGIVLVIGGLWQWWRQLAAPSEVPKGFEGAAAHQYPGRRTQPLAVAARSDTEPRGAACEDSAHL